MTALSADAWAAISLSLRVAIWATVLTLPLAIWIAFWLERGAGRLRAVVDTIVLMPLILPPVVTGYALLIVFSPSAPVGAWLADTFGLTLAFQWTGAVLAAAVMAFPLMVRSIRVSVAGLDPGLIEAARTLGASRTRVLGTVTLPLILPGLLSGATLGFAKALGEFGATITFVAAIPGETMTLPSAIFTALQRPGAEAEVRALVAAAVVLSLLALILSEWLVRRGRR